MIALLDPIVLLTLIMALGACAAIGALGLTLAQRDYTSARLKMITDRRRTLAVEAVDALRPKGRVLPLQRRWSNVQAIVKRLKLLRAGTLDQLKREMAHAGWRDPSAPSLFIAAICTLPLLSRRSTKITPPWSRQRSTQPQSCTAWPLAS